MRIGAKKRPFYRIVVVDQRAKRTGGYIEILGSYDPLTEPKDIKLKQDRIDHWIKQGAQMSNGYLRIIGKAPQRPPRKPKKEKKEESVPTAPSPETPTPETPAEITETEPNEKKEVVDDSAKKTETTETAVSESVKKNEGPS